MIINIAPPGVPPSLRVLTAVFPCPGPPPPPQPPATIAPGNIVIWREEMYTLRFDSVCLTLACASRARRQLDRRLSDCAPVKLGNSSCDPPTLA